MEEKRGTYLSEVVVRLAEWGFSLMPYGVAGSMLICRAILGWSDTPLWEVWYPVFLVSMAGRYLVHVLKIAYGWKNYVYHEGRTSWAMVAVDAAATVATVAYIALYGGETISWYWRYYVISYWIGGGLLAVWLISLFVYVVLAPYSIIKMYKIDLKEVEYGYKFTYIFSMYLLFIYIWKSIYSSNKKDFKISN